jgi:hypothetical protein
MSTEMNAALSAPSTEYLLAQFRCARTRLLLLANEVELIGVSLKDGMITPEGAITWFVDIGADTFMTGGDHGEA